MGLKVVRKVDMERYKVAYATGSRADYGIVKNFLGLLDNDQDIEFSVLVTGSHLNKTSILNIVFLFYS